MERSLILTRAVYLLEGCIPVPSKETLSSLSREELGEALLGYPELREYTPDPFGLLLEAATQEGLLSGMLPPVRGYEHPRYVLNLWVPDEELAYLHFAFTGKDPLWYRGYPEGVFKGLFEGWEGIAWEQNGSYQGFIDEAISPFGLIPCPFLRLAAILGALMGGGEAFYRHLGIEPCPVVSSLPRLPSTGPSRRTSSGADRSPTVRSPLSLKVA